MIYHLQSIHKHVHFLFLLKKVLKTLKKDKILLIKNQKFVITYY